MSRKRPAPASTANTKLPHKAKVPRGERMPNGLGLAYEETLPAELQHAVMCYLANVDPKAAVRLASTSKRQAAVLESLLPRLVREDRFLVAVEDVVPTAGDYLRARAAVGDIDPHVAVLAMLLEAFVRFLFSFDDWLRWRAVDYCSVADAGGRWCVGHDPDHNIIDGVIADLSLGDARGRAQAWYRWLTTPLPPSGKGDRRTVESPADQVFWRHSACSSNGRTHPRGQGLRALCREGIELGGVSDFDVSDTVQEVMLFRWKDFCLSSCKDLCYVLDQIPAERLYAWSRQGGSDQDPDTRRLLGSAAARDGMSRLINTLCTSPPTRHRRSSRMAPPTAPSSTLPRHFGPETLSRPQGRRNHRGHRYCLAGNRGPPRHPMMEEKKQQKGEKVTRAFLAVAHAFRVTGVFFLFMTRQTNETRPHKKKNPTEAIKEREREREREREKESLGSDSRAELKKTTFSRSLFFRQRKDHGNTPFRERSSERCRICTLGLF